jgi:uncharacterized repeat protein (TIGR01451 family)
VPAIFGSVAQDHSGGVVAASGEYGCDISIDVEEPTTSICGTKFFDYNQDGEMNGSDYGLSGWTINLLRFTDCQDGDEWADSVVTSSQGKRKDGSPVDPLRSNPNAALGQAEYDTNSTHFFSLGFGGSITLEFDNYIVNEPGDDIELVEATNEPYPDETVDVFASPDNNTWWYLGPYSKDALIDLSDYSSSILYAKYIRLTDTTNPAPHNNNADAYDLDGVKALHCASGWEIIETQITDQDGHYCFDPVAPGSYRLEEVLQDGWTPTTPVSPPYYELRIEEEENLIYDFGNYQDIQNNNSFSIAGSSSGSSSGRSSGGVDVLGETGAPNLTIDKIVNTEYVNPGDTGIEYKVIITNSGNMTAFAVSLNDSLPDGLVFAGTEEAFKSWIVGDIEPGASTTVDYLVDVRESALPGVYTNLAVAVASNHDQVSASADLEVRDTTVLGLGGGELEPTGFSMKEFIVLVGLLIALAISAAILRKKYI